MFTKAFSSLSAIAFSTDGIHWGTGEYGYLRTGMLTSVAIGAAALWLNATLGGGLEGVWLYDVRDPAQPALLAHLNPREAADGREQDLRIDFRLT